MREKIKIIREKDKNEKIILKKISKKVKLRIII
jgi:hypothetical protein